MESYSTRMNGVRTRKQAKEAEELKATANGNGNGKVDYSHPNTEVSENIFLFYPNIIGRLPIYDS